MWMGLWHNLLSALLNLGNKLDTPTVITGKSQIYARLFAHKPGTPGSLSMKER
jgi:hypothetical protein